MGGDEASATESKLGLVDSTQVDQQDHLRALLDLTRKKDVSSGKEESSGEVQAQICLQLSSLFSSPERLTSIFSQDVTSSMGSTEEDPPNAAGIDFRAVRTLYQNIRTMDVSPVSDAVIRASEKLLEEHKLPRGSRGQAADGPVSDTARKIISCWIILLSNPLLLEPENHPLLQSLARALTHLGAPERVLFVRTLTSLGKEDLEEMVAIVQQCITVQLYEASRVTEAVQLCTKLLKLLHDANSKSDILPVSSFYNDAVNNKDLVDPDKQYYYWRKPQRYAFSFCNFPFILDLGTKCRILQLDSHIEMQEQFQRAFFQGLFNQAGFIEPFNNMRVRRDNLVHDAVTHVQRKKDELKKPLRVQFIGEDAVDEGGVRKEFFQLMVQELFDPKYGMVSYREQTRQFWFSMQSGELAQVQEEQQEKQEKEEQEERKRQAEAEEERQRALQQATGAEGMDLGTGQDGSSESRGHEGGSGTARPSLMGSAAAGPGAHTGQSPASAGAQPYGHRHASTSQSQSQEQERSSNLEDLELRREYELVGMLLGLAIFNSCILDVRFPTVLYKKLLGRPLGLDDLESLDKDLAKGFRDLLAFQGNVQEVFDLNFQVTVEDIFGDKHVIDLVPGGSHIPLTADNRQQYVDACVKFYLETSIHRQFVAFAKGFMHMVPEHLLKLFEPEELELLICGISELDFHDLEKGAHYTDGYTKHHKTIQQFWEIAHGLAESEKRNLLMFVTGCDRSPIRGLGSLKFTISRNGPDSDRLPTAHTCFNHLLLPEYKSKDKLRDRLLTAINNAKGFGLQ